ncbi:MAG: hypothetical protein IJH20_00805 [Bacilli bacterium]|nr:hypothetical protein [Bacilli bacterium]
MKRQDILVKPKIVDKKKVLINFDLGEEAIGIFLDYSIRFYKKSIDKIICSWNRKQKRFIYANSFDFTVIDNGKESDYLLLTGCPDLKDYDLKSGIYVVYSKDYFEIVSRRDLNNYMENYGYDFRCPDDFDLIDQVVITKEKKNTIKK